MFILCKSSTNPKKLSDFKTNVVKPDEAAKIIADKLFERTLMTRKIIFCIKSKVGRRYYYVATKQNSKIKIKTVKGGTVSNSESETRLEDIPEDIFTKIPLNIKSMSNLLTTSKQLRRTVMQKEDNPFSINIPDSNTVMKQYGLNIHHVINGSWAADFLDNFIYIFNVPTAAEKERHLYKMFNHTRKTRQLLSSADEIHASIRTTSNIFEITENSHNDRDFRIMQFLLNLTNTYLDGKVKDIMNLSLTYQLLLYFQQRYHKTLEEACGKKIYKDYFYRIYNDTCLYALYYFKEHEMAPIHLLDFNLYNMYCIYITSYYHRIVRPIPFSPEEFERIDKELIFKMLNIKSMHKNLEMQNYTIDFLMTFWKHKTAIEKLYTSSMMYKYMDYLIERNVTSDELFKNENFVNSIISNIRNVLDAMRMDDRKSVADRRLTDQAKQNAYAICMKLLPLLEVMV